MKNTTRLTAPRALSFLLAFLAVSANAEVDALVRQANEAIAQGRAQQAYDLLEPQEVSRAGDPDFDLAFGMAANQVAQYSRAIMALERALVQNPGNAQARAELGRALFAVRDTRAARALLNEGKMQGIPVVAGESIDQILQAVDRVEAEGRSSYKGYAEFGIGHDTNANSGPEQRNFAVPQPGGSVALLTLDPAGVSRDANFATVGAGFSGRHILAPRWSLIGNITGSLRGYGNDAEQFGMLQVDANLGIAYRVEREEYTLAVQGGTYDIDHSRVRNLAGLVGEWTHRIDGFRQFSTYVQLTRLTYPELHAADVDRSVIGITYANLFRNGFLAYGGLYAGQENERASGVPHFGHKLIGLRLGAQRPLGQNLSVFGTLAYEDRKFGGTDPSFLVGRHDRQTNLSLGMTWLPATAWRVTPQLAWVQNKSNAAVAAYDKTVFSVLVRREF
jgi:tetratricopeptide (TPR) repeat protein